MNHKQVGSSSKEIEIETVKTVHGDDTIKGCKTRVTEFVSFSLKINQEVSFTLADEFRDLGFAAPFPIKFNFCLQVKCCCSLYWYL